VSFGVEFNSGCEDVEAQIRKQESLSEVAVKVSVIIPTYNRAYIIADALESVFAQTFDNFEVIVIDDGSTDNTADVIKRFSDTRLRYIRKKNGGCGSAYNAGIRASGAEYISFLDSDDLWKPEKLGRDVSFLDQHPEVQGVFSDLEKIDSGTWTFSFMRKTPTFYRLVEKRPRNESMVFSQREIFLCLLREIPIKIPTLTIRRTSALSTSLFDESWPSGNDWKFLLEFSHLFRFGYIDRVQAVVRVQDDATHRIHFARDKMLLIELLNAEMNRLSDDHEAVESARWGVSDLTKHLSWCYLEKGQRLRAAAALLRGFRYTFNAGLLSRALAAVLLPDRFRGTVSGLLTNRQIRKTQ
jgi:glycosyltransferase involved in cell wall biosynthesis